MGGCALMSEPHRPAFIHIRGGAPSPMRQDNAAAAVDDRHMNIIAALESATPFAERLVREHTLGLAEHVETPWRVPGRSAAGRGRTKRRDYA